jgi:hypothetical protein
MAFPYGQQTIRLQIGEHQSERTLRGILTHGVSFWHTGWLLSNQSFRLLRILALMAREYFFRGKCLLRKQGRRGFHPVASLI